MPTSNPFPIRLKEARKRAGISQKELGIALGMDASSASSRMNHYEKGRHMPDIQTIRQMADELGVPMAYFFCDSDEFTEIVRLIDAMSDQEIQVLLDDIKSRMDQS